MGSESGAEAWVRLCRADEVKSGERKIINFNGREVGIFNINGHYRALLNRCPHKGAPLCLGRLRPLVDCDEKGDIHYTRDNEILQCPWHMWEFDTVSGRAIADQKVRVKTWDVKLDGGELYLRVS